MEAKNEKIIVAITQGDTNGIGYELIIKTFSDPTMLELCTPIIYGNPKIAERHMATLEQQIGFNIIKQAEEAKEGKVNLLATSNNEAKVEFGKRTEESKKNALEAHERAKQDMVKRLFDVLVTCPAEGLPRRNPKQLTMLVNDKTKVVQYNKGVENTLEQQLQTLTATLKRDFSILNPRIALLDNNSESKKLTEESTVVMGPYESKAFVEEGKADAFDALMVVGNIPMELDQETVKVTCGLPIIHTTASCDEMFSIAGKNEANEEAFRNAIYTAIDIARNRYNYDEAIKNPLPKLYHERKEDGEKVRFIVQDTGKGIDEADLDNIYKFFAKIDGFNEGLGLGLPLTKRHAEDLGGDFMLDTTYKEGCRFIFEIPLA